jgi:hypothetical protein
MIWPKDHVQGQKDATFETVLLFLRPLSGPESIFINPSTERWMGLTLKVHSAGLSVQGALVHSLIQSSRSVSFFLPILQHLSLSLLLICHADLS